MAEAGDLLTLAEARAALRQGTSTASDTEIALLVTAASIAIDRGTGPVVIRTITADTYDGDDDGAGHTTSMIQLRYWPVAAITTVTEDGVTLTAVADYHADLEKGQLWRRSGGYDWRWECGRDNISVTYTAGRFANTAAVDSWWKQGCRLLVRHLWRAEQWNVAGIGPQEFDVPQVAFPSFAIPKAVMDWYGPLWRLSSRDPAEARGGFA